MKKKVLLVLTLLIFTVVLSIACTGCKTGPGSEMGVLHFGYEYVSMSGDIVLLEHDKDNEMFVYTVTKENESDKGCFHFELTYSMPNKFMADNDKELDFTDKEGNEIVFDKARNYYYYGSQTFYISYKNADEITKSAISGNDYLLTCGADCFTPHETQWMQD